MNKQKHTKSRNIRSKSKLSIFIYKFKFELSALSVFLLGVFLLTEKLEIRSTTFGIIKNITTAIYNIFLIIGGWLKHVATDFENSDIVGYILIVASIIILIHRYRIHLWSMYHRREECPKCNEGVNRVHSTLIQKIGSRLFFVRVLNFKCRKCSHHFPVVTPRK